jgi:hypothetical protein
MYMTGRSPSGLDFDEGQLPLGILDMADRIALHSEISEVFADGNVETGWVTGASNALTPTIVSGPGATKVRFAIQV